MYIKKERIEIMNKLEFLVNNNGTMQLLQNKCDGDVIIHMSDGEDMNISNGDMVMLINLYQYIKRYDIQNDFINPYGKNRE